MMDMWGIYVLKILRKIDIFQSACTKQLSIDSYWFASQRYSTDDNDNARNTAPRRYYRQQLRQIFSIKNDTMDKLKAKGEKISGLTCMINSPTSPLSEFKFLRVAHTDTLIV